MRSGRYSGVSEVLWVRGSNWPCDAPDLDVPKQSVVTHVFERRTRVDSRTRLQAHQTWPLGIGQVMSSFLGKSP
jgi:hypothetical protein